MEIITKNHNDRILITPEGNEIPIHDGQCIQYTGIYYTTQKRYSLDNVETRFVGMIHRCRYRYDTGIMGIYVHPLYMWLEGEWRRIPKLNPPKTKYFFYPHLLMLPQYCMTHCYALDYLHTCEPAVLSDYTHITRDFDLNYFWNETEEESV